MNYNELKPLLRQGDCKEVAELCNVSTTFVQNVWRGKATTSVGAQAVMLATNMKIAEREAYTKKIVAAVTHHREQSKSKSVVAEKENSAL